MRSHLTFCALTLLTIPSLVTAQSLPQPPSAEQKEHLSVWHSEKVNDPFFWLREKSNPEVVKYLEGGVETYRTKYDKYRLDR